MTTTLTRELCDQLTGNSPALTKITIDLDLAQLSHEDNRILIFQALKRNFTLTSLCIQHGSLSMRASLALAAGLLHHPTLSSLSLVEVEMDSSFGALALVIQENKKLTSLRLSFQAEECVWTRHLNESVRCLVASDSLEELSIEAAAGRDDTAHSIDLAGVLCRNKSLKRMRFGWTSIITEGTVRDIARLLRTNQSIQSLHLADISFYRGAVELIAVAATGHDSLERLCLNVDLSGEGSSHVFDIQAVSSMLRNSPKLKEIQLNLSSLDQDDTCRLFDSLKSSNLETVNFCGGEMSGAALSRLADILSENETVTSLQLNYSSITDSCIPHLARILNQSRMIEKLSLVGNRLTSEGIVALAAALEQNTSLKELDLGTCVLEDDATAAFASMLNANTTLESLHVGGVREVGFTAFTEWLPRMNGIKSLNFREMLLTKSMAEEFLDSLQLNTTLENVSFCKDEKSDPALDETMEKINHLTALNRGGRGILKSISVSSSLWPLILARSSNDSDVLYCFLREKPTDLIGPKVRKVPSRKRKRDWFEGILW